MARLDMCNHEWELESVHPSRPSFINLFCINCNTSLIAYQDQSFLTVKQFYGTQDNNNKINGEVWPQ